MTIDLAKLRAETLALADDAPCIRCGRDKSYDCSCEQWQLADEYAGLANRLAADTLPLLDEIERLTAENERLRAALTKGDTA